MGASGIDRDTFAESSTFRLIGMSGSEREKEESWYILDGVFEVHWINTLNATQITNRLKAGDTWHNEPLSPHQIECIEEGTIVEVSTPDSVEDNYRVIPGDSQKEDI